MMLVEETSVPADVLPVAGFKAHLRLGSGFSDDAVQDAVLVFGAVLSEDMSDVDQADVQRAMLALDTSAHLLATSAQ